MTGKYPIHIGLHHDVIHPDAPWGLPLGEKTLPDYLKSNGYAHPTMAINLNTKRRCTRCATHGLLNSFPKPRTLPRAVHRYKTHMIGKWHLGHFSMEYLPGARGFDTFYGYLTDTVKYFTHT